MGKKVNSSNQINQQLLEERCVLNKVLQLAGKRWLAEIILLLEDGVNRFSHLKVNLKGISDHVLSRNINALMSAGLITKTIYQEVPLKVEYHLSESGKKLVGLLHDLCKWGKENIETE
ncbi:MAG: helix-turn-helix transcriptional regulator [Bacteroidetes bacterium]|nr:helix-turn-helix transcriptional regulator [Bacteroidota bacterium]